jgi:hypothetical protein
MIGKRLARRPPALERFDRLCPGRRILVRQFVLSRCRLQIFELKLHLILQPRRAFRARPVELTPQFLDRKLEMGARGFAAGKIRLRIGRFGLGDRGIGLNRKTRLALREDYRMRGHIRRNLQAKTVSRPRSDAKFPADGASRSRRADSRAGRRRSAPRRRWRSATESGRAPAAW